MTAFAAATERMFRDRHLAVDALYLSGGVPPGQPLRVIRRQPDRIASFGDGRFVTDAVLLDFRVADVPEPVVGDVIEIGVERYELRSAPVRDGERLVWSAEARPV